ncbi:MAG: hypothetical protein K8J09_03920, partial [Planctomycetes bacterium]|nr:hypothetical protein [Planctomycetota bacterium]
VVASAQQHLALAERPGDRLAEALTAQAEVLLRRGNYGAAKAVIERAVAAADHAGQPQQQALAHLVFAEIEVRSGRFGPGAQHLGVARRGLGAELADEPRGTVELLQGFCDMRGGHESKAVDHLYAALTIGEAADLPHLVVEAHLELGAMCYRRGAHAAAEAHLADSVLILDQHGLELLRQRALALRGLLQLHAGDEAGARGTFATALELAERFELPVLQASALCGLGYCAAQFDRAITEATDFYGRSLTVAERAGDLERQALLLVNIAEMHRLRGDAPACLRVLDAHVELFAQVDQPSLRIDLNRVRAEALSSLGHFEAAYTAAWTAADTARWYTTQASTVDTVRRELDRRHAQREQRTQRHTLLWSAAAATGLLLTFVSWRLQRLTRRAHQRQLRLNGDLQAALAQVQQLEGMLPICSHCKSVRDDDGYWQRIESYLAQRSRTTFTHGICPRCAADLYPGLLDGTPPPGPAS